MATIYLASLGLKSAIIYKFTFLEQFRSVFKIGNLAMHFVYFHLDVSVVNGKSAKFTFQNHISLILLFV